MSTFTRRKARNLSDAARAKLNRPPVAGEIPTPLRTAVVGLDPHRILLFGSGPLIGYGVCSRREAIDGPLARFLAERTGRGIIIEARVRLGLPIEEAMTSLGGAGTTTFSAAVWAPRFSDELRYPTPERSRTAIRTMLHQFRAQSRIALVLCELPTPLGTDWRSTMRRPRVAAYNAILAEEAASMRGVTSVALGTYTPTEPASTTAPWHDAQAELLAPAVLHAIRATRQMQNSTPPPAITRTAPPERP